MTTQTIKSELPKNRVSLETKEYSGPRRRGFVMKVILPIFLALATPKLFAVLDGPDGEIRALALQSDGKSIIGGDFPENRLMRRNVDGSVDPSFTSTWITGGFNGPVNTIATQPDDRIIVGGEFTSFDTSLAGSILRLHADGSLDSEFVSNTGTGFDDQVTSIHLLQDGRILVAGKFTSFDGSRVGGFVRLNRDGTLDQSFALAGFAPDEWAEGRTDGAILAMSLPFNGSRAYLGGEFRSLLGIESAFAGAVLFENEGKR